MRLGRTLGTVLSATLVASTLAFTGGAAVAAGTAPTDAASPKWPGADRTGSVRLRGQVPSSVRGVTATSHRAARLVGDHRTSSRLTLSFTLPLHDQAGLDQLINDEATTHRFLSRAEIYQRFAPPQAQVDALRTWLTHNGYTVTRVSPNHTSVVASAPTSTVERSLATSIGDFERRGYTASNGVKVPTYPFYANTTAPQVPANLGITAISGLSDVTRFFTAAQVSAAQSVGRVPDVRFGRDTRAGGGYYPQDLRSLYDVAGHGVDATGQTLGFVLWGAGETQTAMSSYATTTGDTPITVDAPCVATGNSATVPSACTTQQAAPNHLVSVLENGNTNGSAGTYEYAGNVETALDIEAAHSVATGAGMKYYLANCTSAPPASSGLTNATCNGSDLGMEEAVEDAANDTTLHSVSNSWGYGGEVEFGANDPFRLTVESSFALAAAAGTTFWFSTGDSGTYESGYPADSQYVVSVGGTSLFSTKNLAAGDTSQSAVRSTAATWTGSGSWCSNIEARPAWQIGSAVATKAACPGRSTPDISAVADPNTGFYYVATRNNAGGTTSGGVGGTSLAAPVMNGLEATTEAFLAQQTYPGGTVPPIGFEGPKIYQLGNSANASSYFYDVECGNTANPTGGPDGDAAGKGWDPATGFGELDWFRFSTGYAISLGATNLTQPTSIDPGYAYTCAQTPTNAAERGVSLPTDTVGYAVGTPSGTTPWPAKFLAAGSWGASNLFLKTTDGGATWQGTNSDMLDVACVSPSTCTEVGDGGKIRRTTNGGTTWTYIASPFKQALTSIECPSATTCYAAGDRGTVLKSTDAGTTWAYAATADGNPLYGLSCPSVNVCYAVDLYAHVERTTDGASSFSLLSTPVTVPGLDVPGSGGPNPYAGLFGISCTSDTACVAVGGYPPAGNTDPPIVTTTDGGATWTRQTSNAGATHYLNGVSCLATTCYAVGRAGTIVTSTDSGVTWTPMTSGTTGQLTGISCTAVDACVATGQAGVVDVLTGTTWTPTTAQAAGNFLAGVTCLSGTSCLAVGKQGATLAFDPTNVAGSAALQAGGGTTATMNALSCADASTCVAVGTAGAVLRTANGGQTWTARTSTTTVALAGVSCVGQQCEAVGAPTAGAAVVVASADGGVTWAPQTSGSTVALSGVTCTSDTTCVAVGAGGKVITTSNGGSTWTTATSGTSANLASVTCVALRCYAVGAIFAPATTATAIASADGGTTWTSQSSGSPQGLASVACANPDACFATGTLGTVVATVDGGTTWAQQGNPLSGPVTALNSGPALTTTYATDCSGVRCVIGTASAGDLLTTPLITVTVHASGPYGSTPSLTAGLPAADPSITYTPAVPAGTVTGTLTCSTTATSASDPGTFPVSSCSGLGATGYSVVYDLVGSDYSIGKAAQAITFAAISDHTYGDLDFTPSATASSGLPVTFTAAGDCDIATGGDVEILGAGSCTVTASQAGNTDYAPASDVAHTFAIAKADQTVAFGSIDPATFGDSSFTISPTASSGLSVGVVATGACSVNPSTSPATVTITGSGTCTITASQPGDANFNAAPDVVRTFEVSKANQTITFDPIAEHTFGDAPFTVSPTASSGLPVSITGAGQCTVDNGLVTITGAGTCTLTASQTGDADHNPAADVSRTFDVAKAAQTITIAQPASTTLDQGTVAINTSASSGLPVMLTASGSCSINGTTVSLAHAGTCAVLATQGGDSNYEAADPVTRTFTIAPGAQTITFDAVPDHLVGDAPFELHATASSGLAVTFTSQTLSVCTVVGSAVVLHADGTCTVTAAQSGDTDWNVATPVERSFAVAEPAPGTAVVTVRTVAHPVAGPNAVSVHVTGNGASTPSGSVAVSSGTHTCTATLNASGLGACTLSLRAGRDQIDAAYPGNAHYDPAAGVATVTVAKARPTLTTSIAVKRAGGRRHRVVTTVRLSDLRGLAVSGSVRVKVINGPSCRSTVHPTGIARCAVTVKRKKVSLRITYYGDADHAGVTVHRTVRR